MTSTLESPYHYKRSWTQRNSPGDQSISPKYKSTKMATEGMTSDQKLDLLLSRSERIETNTQDLLELGAKFESIERDVETYRRENIDLIEIIKTLDGRLQKAELEIKRLSEGNIDLSYRSMKHNMICYGIKEPAEKENCYASARAFLIDKMKIPRDRLNQDVVIDVTHRLGSGDERPLIIRFTTHAGRRVAMSFCGNLKGTPFHVREQLPPTMADRASAQLGELKIQKAVKTNKATLIRDTLYSKGKKIDPQFCDNEIILDTNLVSGINFEDIIQSPIITKDTNKIQCFAYGASNMDEAKTALAKVISAPSCVKASSVSYAYSIKDMGTPLTGYSDGKDFGLSRLVLDTMQERLVLGIVIICKFNGTKKLNYETRNKVVSELLVDLIDQEIEVTY